MATISISSEPPRHRKHEPSSNPSHPAEDSSSAHGDPGLMKGLLSCIAGVGGVSIGIWLLFFVFLEPYDPSKLPCTRVGAPSELAEAVVAFEAMGFNWRLYGQELGLSSEQLDSISHDSGEDSRDEIGSVLRLWYNSSKKPCWETAVQALLQMDELKSAKQLAKKYKVYWKSDTSRNA